MLVWCTISVAIMSQSLGVPVFVKTAAKGIVIHETGSDYVVDFSKYAKEKDYRGDYSEFTVNKDNCMEDMDKK